ncbi:MAG: DUF3343 domain-containing protein [Faecousia sp.]
MRYYYITFRSVTFAQRGERVLQSAKIRCTLQRTPRWMEEQGCGYCLRLYTKELAAAAELLVREGVPFRKLYEQTAQGQLEEVTL